MITKLNMLHLLQNRLAGGDAPKDVRKMFPIGVISKIVNFAYSDVVTTNPDAAADMAINYTFTPESDASGYYVTLYPQPIAGTLAIFTIEDESNSYNVQDKVQAKAIQTLRGSNKNAAIYFSDKLRFNKQPVGDVTVTMVPNVYQMEDDDILLSASQQENGGEIALFNMCLQILQGEKYQDELNDNRVDSQQNGR